MKERMKKFLKSFAVFVMALASCFALFACEEASSADPDAEQTPIAGEEGNGKTDGESNGSGTGTSGGESSGSGTGTNGGESSGSGTVVDYTITEAEWASATDIRSSQNVTMTMTQVSFGSSIPNGTNVSRFDGTTYYETDYQNHEEYDTKVTEGDAIKYYAYRFDEVWEKQEENEEDYNDSCYYFNFPSRFAYSENFVYNQETHEYEATNHTVMGQTFAKVILGFENKKCVKLYYEIEGMGSATFVFEYGTTETIVLPVISE